MSFPAELHAIASIASERLLFSLGVGTLLAVIVWLLLRVLPRKDSRTSFAVWFATLVITAVLPVLGLFFSHAGRGATSPVITVSSAWAISFFITWASIACIGLLRVAIALWQVRSLRSTATALDDVEQLGPELRELVEQFKLDPTLCAKSRKQEILRLLVGKPPSRSGFRLRAHTPAKRLKMGRPGFMSRSRSIALLVSSKLEVPTAIGFFKPAIVLPQWMVDETPAGELKYIVLHELEHLRRRDDWTNLAQQIVKALLFFVPSVWWIERKLALEREMACDDAVLAQSGTARGYAECLARVAERSFLRRQLALAQAAVSRLRQLTVRVAKILDPNRPKHAPMWKPAVPAVIVVAGLCVFTASKGPQLVGFADGSPMAQRSAQTSVVAGSLTPSSIGMKTVQQTDAYAPKFIPANLKISSESPNTNLDRTWSAGASSKQRKVRSSKPVIRTLANLRAESKIPRGAIGPEAQQASLEYVTVRERFVMVVMQGDAATAPQRWQVHVVEISVTQAKPTKQVPRKI